MNQDCQEEGKQAVTNSSDIGVGMHYCLFEDAMDSERKCWVKSERERDI